jgi:HK97 family phage portal protein
MPNKLLTRINTAFSILFRASDYPAPMRVPYGFMGWAGFGSGTATNFSKYTEEGYRRNPIIYTCIREIATATKKIRIVLKRDGEIVEEPTPEEKPLWDLIQRPNKNQTMGEFMELWATQINIAGTTYIRGIGLGTERLGEMVRMKTSPQIKLIPPNMVSMQIVDGEIVGYRVGSETVYNTDEMMYVMFTDPMEYFTGLSPIKPIAEIADTYNGMLTYWSSLMKNLGIPAAVIATKGHGSLNKTQRQELIDQWQAQYGGSKNAGKVGVLPGEGMDYVKLGIGTQELDWRGSEGILTRRMCMAFGVPSQILGDPDTSKYSNYKEARQALYQETVIPNTAHFVSEFSSWLLPKYEVDGYAIDLDYENVDALKDGEDQRVTRLSARTWWTTNEKRKADGLEEIPGGDEILMPFNLVPLSEMGNAPEFDPNALSDEKKSEKRTFEEPLPHVHKGSFYPTETDRRNAFLSFEKDRMNYDRKYERVMKTFFTSQRERLAARLSDMREAYGARFVEKRDINAGFMNNFMTSGDENDKLIDHSRSMQAAVYLKFGQRAIKQLKAKGLFEIERPDIKQFIADDLAARSELINQTTADELQKIINEGVSNSESIEKISQSVIGKFDEMSIARARMIARTEVNRAANKATQFGWQQTGLVKYQEWLSARDERVRDTHVAMDGQVHEFGQDFNSPSGASGPCPGQLGEPGEDINCRCVLAPLASKSEAI